MTTIQFDLDALDVAEIAHMFNAACDHPSELRHNLLHWDLKHTLHERYDLAFCDIDRMIHIYRTDGVEKLIDFISDGKSTKSQAKAQ